jgi:hypothetical protein
MRTILGRAIAPATAALENMHDAADDAAIVNPLHTANIGWQIRLNPSPLLIIQPKQIPAHNLDPSSKNESGSYCHRAKVNEF